MHTKIIERLTRSGQRFRFRFRNGFSDADTDADAELGSRSTILQSPQSGDRWGYMAGDLYIGGYTGGYGGESVAIQTLCTQHPFS